MSEEQTVEAPVEAPVQTSTEAPVEPAAVTLAPQQSSEPASEDWKGGLSDELRDHPSLKKYSTVENLAKGYINASSMLGKDKLVKPSNEDEWNEFYTEMGRPEGATGYKFTYEAEVPEELQAYTNGRVDAFKETAHQLGLTSEQADGLHRWYMEGNVENVNNLTRQVEDMQKESESEFARTSANAKVLSLDDCEGTMRNKSPSGATIGKSLIMDPTKAIACARFADARPAAVPLSPAPGANKSA